MRIVLVHWCSLGPKSMSVIGNIVIVSFTYIKLRRNL